jgi:hypothetical protein
MVAQLAQVGVGAHDLDLDGLRPQARWTVS